MGEDEDEIVVGEEIAGGSEGIASEGGLVVDARAVRVVLRVRGIDGRNMMGGARR